MACKSVQSFLDSVFGLKSNKDEVTVYRGHEDQTYLLKPHVFREAHFKENEHLLVSELMAAQPSEFMNDRSTLEVLVRMQHYDMPTRLLDVSHNPLVALYFATSSRKRSVLAPPGHPFKTRSVEQPGEVVCLHVHKDLVKYFDSDTISCITNVARLNPKHKERLRHATTEEDFNERLPTKRLVHFINAEKPGFLPEIDPDHLHNVYFVKPKQNNRRIIAQAGGFFTFGLVEEIPPFGLKGIRVERIAIDPGRKNNLRTELDKISLNERSMFPELDRSAQYIKRSITSPGSLKTSR